MFIKISSSLVVFGISTFLAAPGAALPVDRSVLTWPGEADPAAQSPPGMTYIPGGTAIIGLDEKEIQDMGLESIVDLQILAGSVPRRELPMKGFYLDTAEVTNHEWQLYLEATGQDPSEDLVQYYWKDGKVPEGQENHPITCISFKEASAYAAWAGKRLPTEEEWEYAARGAGGFLYPWGNEFDSSRAHCSMSKMVGGRRTQECGTLEAGGSPFGVLDMAGNVWEWTSSPYVGYEGYEDIKIKTRYTKGRAEKYSATALFNAQKLVIRGGSWQNPKTALISALRQPADATTWNTTVGFRCAKSAQAGIDVLADSMAAVGRHYFKGYELDLSAAQVVEVTEYDDTNAVTSHRGIMFAPIKSWKSLATVQKQSLKDPVVAGLLYTSEEIIVPRLSPGAYWVAYQAADKRVDVPKDATFPEEGWVYQGWEEHEAANPAKPGKQASGKKSSKPGRNKPDPADSADSKDAKEEAKPDDPPEESEEKDEGEQEPAEERYEASKGSVVYDRRQDHLLLINRSNLVQAALPLDEVKDSARPAPSQLKIQKTGADERRKLPATERRTYVFTIALAARKAVTFELPLRFHPKPLDLAADKGGQVTDEVGIEDR